MRLGDRWGAETSPDGFELAYADAANQIAPGIVDFAQSIATAGETIISAINRARTQVAMTNQQRDLLDLQLQRAQQGLPPLNVNTMQQGGLTLSPTMLIVGGLLLVYLLTRKG